jgi:hypothetical protein
VLYVRTGFGEDGIALDQTSTSGLHPKCMPLLHDLGIAVLVSDGDNDAYPSTVDFVHAPVHVLALVAMGLWLVDNAALKDLAACCARTGRYDFCTVIAPIPFRRATGSLVNPVAVF